MSLKRFAIAYTCFLIDWAYWRYRDVLLKLFQVVFVPETVLREVKSEHTVEWIASSLATAVLVFVITHVLFVGV